MELILACLSYDFLGTSAGVTGGVLCDDASSGGDDLVVVQLPTTWRSVFIAGSTSRVSGASHSVSNDSNTNNLEAFEFSPVDILFRLYSVLTPELSALVSHFS
ncbi:unnamed protein product [Protopolystoma xenopodis]|uniref:Secreted protein n=1 Tax=Protopolystoma xenopodis TaxID=117903 RepID=A0A448X2Z5_9PLAT|nr:unnamed protein product [Protopolystoma xenopodis]